MSALSPRSGIQVSSVYPTYTHIKGHIALSMCVWGGGGKPVAVELRCHATALIFSFMDSFVFKHQVLFRVDFLSVTLDHRAQCPRVGLGVKI